MFVQLESARPFFTGRSSKEERKSGGLEVEISEFSALTIIISLAKISKSSIISYGKRR